MRLRRAILLLGLVASAATTATAQDFLDRLDEALTFSGFDNHVRLRLSGTLDLEGYAFDGPAPGLIRAVQTGRALSRSPFVIH